MAFLCCLILHLYLQPGIYKSIDRMRYLFAHKHNFEQVFLPFMICLMRLSCELCIEITEVMCTYILNSELWMVMCYSALTCISYIDQQYFDIMDDKMKTKLVEKYEMCLKIENEQDFESTHVSMLYNDSPLNTREKIYYALLMVIEFTYETVYFYFFPYLAIIYAAFVF